MRKFDYKRAGSYEEAAELIKAGGAVLAAELLCAEGYIEPKN